MWKALTAEKQQKYQDRAAALREEYKEKMEDFFEEHPEAKPIKAPSVGS